MGYRSINWQERSAFIKCWQKITRAEQDTLNWQLWVEVSLRKNLPLGTYIRDSLSQLGLENLRATSASPTSFKKVVNKTIKALSLEEDKPALVKRVHAWYVLNNYVAAKPPKYLIYGFNIQLKEKLLQYRMGIMLILPHLPPWKRKPRDNICLLCSVGRSCTHNLQLQKPSTRITSTLATSF